MPMIVTALLFSVVLAALALRANPPPPSTPEEVRAQMGEPGAILPPELVHPRYKSVVGHSPGHGTFHPVAWCQYYDGGKVWATTLGHDANAFRANGEPGADEFQKWWWVAFDR
ncbi:MAG: hypothetical protein ACRYG4_17975 [Janthinobacterium lividum]